MRRYLFALLEGVVIVLMLFPLVVFAQTATTTTADSIHSPGDAFAIVKTMAQAFHSHAWQLGAGLLLTLVVAGARLAKLLHWIPDSYDRWVAVVIAMLTSISVGLQMHESWLTILATAANVGAIAVGGWELVIKHVVDWIKPAPKPAPAPTPPAPAPAGPPSGT